jgi:hypothetical protein
MDFPCGAALGTARATARQRWRLSLFVGEVHHGEAYINTGHAALRRPLCRARRGFGAVLVFWAFGLLCVAVRTAAHLSRGRFTWRYGSGMLVAAHKKQKKNAAAVALGRKGGKKRAATLSAEELGKQGKKAAAARWTKKGK